VSLEGPRIRLAPLRDEDSAALFAWINDRELVLLNAAYKPVHEADHAAWFDAVRARDDVVIFGIRLVDGDDLIGSCQLLAIDPLHRTAELQIRIGVAAARGRGHGSEAVGLLLRHGFGDLGLERVQLTVFADNEAALRTYAKAGFTREGTLRSAAEIDGRRRDVVVMGILREELEDGGAA